MILRGLLILSSISCLLLSDSVSLFGVQLCSKLCKKHGSCLSLRYDYHQCGITTKGQSKQLPNKSIVKFCEDLRHSWNIENNNFTKGYVRLRAGKDSIMVKRHETRLTWSDARSVCRSEGGDLVKVDTKEKQTAIHRKLSRRSDLVRKFYMWIALVDEFKTNTFQWSDGQPLKYSKWCRGEPDHMTAQDCVSIVQHLVHGFCWYAAPCDRKNGFVCEKQYF